jgi:sec-independent protein translocase protein TatB
MKIFDIGQNELLIIAVLAIIILGPERLAKVAKEAGKLVKNFKSYFSSLSDELKTELEFTEDLKNEFNGMTKNSSIAKDIKKEMDEITKI